MAVVKVGNVSDFVAGSGKLVEAEGSQIALFNVDGTLYAIDDVCSHAGGPLSEGALAGYIVTCPFHGSTFDVRTGQNVGPPARTPVAAYKVVLQDSDVFVEV
jgi:nitrite reductase/ring-hydroxylating ferredoxin subunit